MQEILTLRQAVADAVSPIPVYSYETPEGVSPASWVVFRPMGGQRVATLQSRSFEYDVEVLFYSPSHQHHAALAAAIFSAIAACGAIEIDEAWAPDLQKVEGVYTFKKLISI